MRLRRVVRSLGVLAAVTLLTLLAGCGAGTATRRRRRTTSQAPSRRAVSRRQHPAGARRGDPGHLRTQRLAGGHHRGPGSSAVHGRPVQRAVRHRDEHAHPRSPRSSEGPRSADRFEHRPAVASNVRTPCGSPRTQSIRSLAELKGKTIAVPSLTGIIIDSVVYLLQRDGVERHDVRFVQTPFPAMGDQLQAGHRGRGDRDAAVQHGHRHPWLSCPRRRHRRSRTRRQRRHVDEAITTVWSAPRHFAADNPEAITAWRNSLREAIDLLDDNPSDARAADGGVAEDSRRTSSTRRRYRTGPSTSRPRSWCLTSHSESRRLHRFRPGCEFACVARTVSPCLYRVDGSAFSWTDADGPAPFCETSRSTFAQVRSSASSGAQVSARPPCCELSAVLSKQTAAQSRSTANAVTRPPTGVVMVFQDYQNALLPWRTVARNIGLGLEGRIGRRERDSRVAGRSRWSASTNTATTIRGGCPAGWLSACRSPGRWLCEPTVLLMDEPFGALDAITKASLQDVLLDVQRRRARPSFSSPTTSTRRSTSATGSWSSAAGPASSRWPSTPNCPGRETNWKPGSCRGTSRCGSCSARNRGRMAETGRWRWAALLVPIAADRRHGSCCLGGRAALRLSARTRAILGALSDRDPHRRSSPSRRRTRLGWSRIASASALIVGAALGSGHRLLPRLRGWVEASIEVLRTVPAVDADSRSPC